MNARNSLDLNNIRPSAELDHAAPVSARHTHAPRPAARRVQRERTGKRWSLWGRLFAGLAGVVALAAVGIAGTLYFFSPAELVRDQLVRQVKSSTGRDLRITGGTRVIFYPSLGVSLGKVELSSAPNMAEATMLRAERIEVSVALMPLLSRKVRVERINLVRPIVDLHIDANGRQSWDFAARQVARRFTDADVGASHRRLVGLAPVAKAALVPLAVPAAGTAHLDMLEQLELRSVVLTNAVISYRDDRSGFSERVEDVDMQLSGGRLADPLRARGQLVWQKERLVYDARLDSLSQIITGRAAKVRVTVSGRPLSAGFDGTLKLADMLEVAGQSRLNGDSLTTSANWLGVNLPNAAPLGGFQVSGRLVASPKSVALNGATFMLGKTKASGTVLVALRDKRPYLSADLNMSEVDVEHLTAGFAGASVMTRRQSAPVFQQPRRAAPLPSATPPRTIEDLLRRSEQQGPVGGAGRFAPQVRGYTDRNEWSAEAIDVSALGMLDAKARLRIDGLRVSGLAIGRTVLRLALADKAARIDVDDLQLYGGNGKGVITVQPGRRGIGLGANVRVDKVAARALLKDAADFERLDGRGNLVVVVSAAGKSQKEIANSLNGTANFTVTDGAIVGWNFAKILRGVQRGQFSNLDATPSEKTDFSELAASFAITNGNAATKDLRMLSPLLRLTGDGTVGIGPRNLNLLLRPVLVSSLQGQGAGSASATGLMIPLKVTGAWHDPRVVPDFSGLSKAPGQLVDQARNIGRQFQGKSVGDMVRGVLGGTGQAASGDSSSGNAGAIFNRFIGK